MFALQNDVDSSNFRKLLWALVKKLDYLSSIKMRAADEKK